MPHRLKRSCARLLLLASSLATLAQANAQTPAPSAPSSDHPPIPIPFHLDQAGFVTLVIEKPDGARVRNLISETHFEAGDNTAWWDGLDDLGRDTNSASFGVYHIPGKDVEPGSYRVRGLVRPAIHAVYEFTPYSHGNPPWKTADAASQWIGNHTAPNAMVYLPPENLPEWPGHPAPAGQVVVGSYVTEGGSGMAFLDTNGNKLYGIGWIGGNWTGAAFLARDIGPHPVRGVYVYSASSWRIEDGFAELRFNEAYMEASKADNKLDATRYRDRPLLPETFKFPAPPQQSEGAETYIHGIAAYNGILVASLPNMGKLMFIDDARHVILGVAPVSDPRGVAFDHQGRLLLLAGRKLVRYQLPPSLRQSGEFNAKTPKNPPPNHNAGAPPEPTPMPAAIELPAPSTLIDHDLLDPAMVAVDSLDRIYVTDHADSNQVKVFKPDGSFLRAVGEPGVSPMGPYNPNQMRNPMGLTVDADGLVWVAENDKAPKRISAWTLSGKLAKVFYGPAKYGGGGWVDPVDKTRFFYTDDSGAIEFKLDWNNQTAVPASVYFRPEKDPLKIRSSGLPGDNDGRAPSYPIHVGERTYLTDAYDSNPTGGIPIATLWNLDKGVAKPVAAMGNLNEWPLFGSRAHYSIVWTGQIQPKYSEKYTFEYLVDYGGRVYIDDKPVIDRSSPRNKNSGSITLEAGRKYAIRVDMDSRAGSGRATLQWSSPSQKKESVPTTALFPPDAKSDNDHGLKADYFAGDKFDQFIATRTDARIDFSFQGNTPGPLLTDRNKAFRALLPAGADLSKDKFVFLWTDNNADGEVQPDEIQVVPGEVRSVKFGPDLSVVAATGQVYKPARIDDQGIPHYDLKSPVDYHIEPNRVASSGGGEALLAGNGDLILTTPPKPFSNHSVGGLINGKTGWSYPSLWPGLHASHNAASWEFPGELIGTTRLIGSTIKPAGNDVGDLWAINGNKGNLYFFTSDGLFVATLFKDGRTASWTAPEAKHGMLCDDFSLNEECFFPSMTQTNDGKVYIVATWVGSIIRVDGLDGIKRLPPTDLNLTPDLLAGAKTWFREQESRRQQAAAPSEIPVTIALLNDAPKVDGNLSEWPNPGIPPLPASTAWNKIDVRTMQVGDWGHRKIATSASLGIHGDKLFIAVRTDDPKLLENSGESLPLTFKTGGAIDLQLGLDPKADPKRTTPVLGDERLLVTLVKGKPLAALYRPVAAERKGDKASFSSPMRSVYMDRVDDVSDGVAIASGVERDAKDVATAYTYEISIPLSALGLKAQPGLTLRGDIGVLRGNGYETLDRVYWHNKSSGLVSDVPSEAELLPNLWGPIELR